MSLDLGAKFVAVMAYEPTFGAIGSCGLDVDRSMDHGPLPRTPQLRNPCTNPCKACFPFPLQTVIQIRSHLDPLPGCELADAKEHTP